MSDRCERCGVEFEPKTFRTADGMHAGCYVARMRAAMRRAGEACTHYTPAEDSSKWAFAHRTWGCPDEGAIWPHGYEELAMHD